MIKTKTVEEVATLPIADLHSTVGGADKVYHIAIAPSGTGFEVPFAYGRRGQTLQRGTKSKNGPVPYEKALQMYQKELTTKLREGYQYAPGISGPVFGTPTASGVVAAPPAPAAKENSGYQPQLLRPITEEEAETYITDPDYCAQEKLDGKRIMYKVNGGVIGINKKGIVIPISPSAATAVERLGRVLIDTETIGEVLFVFGLQEYDGRDYLKKPYGEVLDTLKKILAIAPDDNIRLVYTAASVREKQQLFALLKKGGKEGIVFKSLSAPYKASRTFSQVKCKFYETASVVVDKVNDKASVLMGLFREDGSYFTVGNVTIPPNYEMPKAGSVIEVRYLYAYKGGSLFQPTYLGTRDDVDREECLESQIKYTAKNGNGG